VSALLRPLAAAYGTGVALRLALYRRRLFRVRDAGRPVISVGNVAAGGTGKTPFVLWLAGELASRGLTPAILTRGYGRSSRGTVVVSDGAGALASVDASGDEAAVLARALPGVPVVADGNRSRGAARALALKPATSVFILDDGFSHVGLARNVDLVLLDATAPDAGGALLPEGGLREPLSSLARADVIVVTKSEQADPAAAASLAARYAPGVPLYRAETEVTGIVDARGTPVRRLDLPGPTLAAVAGLARPDAFFATLRSLGIEPAAEIAFPDHAPYGPEQLGRIAREAAAAGATAVVTTDKDSVKLEGRCPLPLYRVSIRMKVAGSSFLPDLLGRLSRPPN
jgi:tetraacyldisaccharide 4'-kinase